MSPVKHFLAFLALAAIALNAVGQSACPKFCENMQCKPGEGCFFIHNVCVPNKPCDPIEPVCAPLTCGPNATECTVDCPTGFHCELTYPADCKNLTQACYSNPAAVCPTQVA